MTSSTDPPMTMAERYSSAIDSGNLLLGERRGDADILIAAGLVPDGLPAALYRLLVEYDSVRAEHMQAVKSMTEAETHARRQNGDNAATGETAKHRSAKILRDAQSAALTAHVLILSALPSLRDAKQRFGAFACIQATKRRFMRPDAEVAIIAGQVLDVFLRPQCHHCQGRGFNGASHRGEEQKFCRPCRGTGHRSDQIGKDEAQRGFAAHLLMQTDAMMYELQRDIRTGLPRVAQAKTLIAEATASG
jgi:hypothetical protein